jgi:hypothetical protein
VLDRLVRRPVLAEADRVVGEDVDDAQLHQRRHADGVAAVVAEGQEGAAVGDVAAVHGDAVHHRRHAELADAVVDVAADLPPRSRAGCRRVEAQRRRVAGVREVRAGQVGAAAEQLGQRRGEGLEGELAGLAAGDRLGLDMGADRGLDATSAQPRGSSPRMRRRYSAASSGCAAL